MITKHHGITVTIVSKGPNIIYVYKCPYSIINLGKPIINFKRNNKSRNSPSGYLAEEYGGEYDKSAEWSSTRCRANF